MAGTRVEDTDGRRLLLVPGQAVDGFEIEALLGEGGFGQVFAARKCDIKRACALKVLDPEKAALADFLDRFRNEGQAAGLIDHNNVVEIWAFGKLFSQQGLELAYIAMERLYGVTLRALLGPADSPLPAPALEGIWRKRLPGAATARLSPADTLDLLLPVFDAVAHGHQRGVIHRDLKPENIFVSYRDGRAIIPKVLDYGIAKFPPTGDQPQTMSRVVMGTPGFMAPEIFYFGAARATTASDQYALGAILYECLTGRRIAEPDSALPTGKLVWPARLVPKGMQRVVRRMLQTDPADRYPKVEDALAALLPWAGLETRAFYARRSDRNHPSRRSPLVWGTLVAGVIAVLGAAWVGARVVAHRAVATVPDRGLSPPPAPPPTEPVAKPEQPTLAPTKTTKTSRPRSARARTTTAPLAPAAVEAQPAALPATALETSAQTADPRPSIEGPASPAAQAPPRAPPRWPPNIPPVSGIPASR